MINGIIVYFIGIPFWILTRSIMLLFKRKEQTNMVILREIILSIFVMYLLSLIKVTLFPVLLNRMPPFEVLKTINYMPFVEVKRFISDGYFSYIFTSALIIRNYGGNFILLMPLSVISLLLYSKFQKSINNFLLCLFTSIMIEMLQLAENMIGVGLGRSSDINDIILNTLGAVFAFYIFRGVSNIYTHYGFKVIKSI